MKQFYRRIFFIVFFAMVSAAAHATHIFGADFFYEHLTGLSYRVTLAIYGDCAGQNFPFLQGSMPVISLRDGNNVIGQFHQLTQDGTGVEVTPVCPSQRNNTTCRGGVIPGVTRYIYSSVITLPYRSANWHFFFNGDMSSSSSAGRSINITNLQNGGSGTVMGLDAALNNLTSDNSSPQFTTIPTPFYCVNTPQQYNQGAVDIDRDSLSYALIQPIDQNGNPVPYRAPFTAGEPLSTTAGSFSFSNTTGQLNFTPNNTQYATVVYQVKEYRNGVVVGSATREMAFVVLANCANNTPPTGNADTSVTAFIGGVIDNTGPSAMFNVCVGTPQVHFGIRPRDPDGDSIEVSLNGIPQGAIANITNNNTPNPSVIFDWNTATVQPGIYNFFLTYKDNGCPFSSQQTQAYSVRIVRPSQAAVRVLYPTECAHKALVEYTFTEGVAPRNIVVKQGGNTVSTFTAGAATYTDSLDAGTFTVEMSSPLLLCPSQSVITVRDSGIYPYPPAIADAFYCKNDPPVALAATGVSGSTVFWYDSLSRAVTGLPILPNTAVPGIFTWYASQRYKVCQSLVDTGYVYVTEKPVADFIVPPDLCSGDTIDVRFTGHIGVGPILDYQWGWNNATYVTGDDEGPYRVHWGTPGIKTVKLQVFENKCPSDPVDKQVNVKATPVADFTANNVCQYDAMTVSYTADTLPGQQYLWDFDQADIPSGTVKGPYNLRWNSGGTKHLFLTVSKDGCSDTASMFPVVYEIPAADILNEVPGTVCLGDKIYLEHAGDTSAGVTFKWTPGDIIRTEAGGKIFTYVTQPTVYTLQVSNSYGCVDSDAINYSRVEPCCQFGYPNAFTPNNDGNNDVFHIKTYGNSESFSLSIFNRWGQRVFYTGNPKDGWDGRLNGKDCEMGTYYYVLKAKCLTGHDESEKGEFMLIR